jgi:hypothetical protein
MVITVVILAVISVVDVAGTITVRILVLPLMAGSSSSSSSSSLLVPP